MRNALARVILRPEGKCWFHHEESIMWWCDSELISTPEGCVIFREPIVWWLAGKHAGDAVRRLWWSVPELLDWSGESTRNGQDMIVHGGVTLASGLTYRLVGEQHAQCCNCAWCQDEPGLPDRAYWVDPPAHDIAGSS